MERSRSRWSSPPSSVGLTAIFPAAVSARGTAHGTQSRGEVLAPEQGEIVIFATRHRPVQGSRGYYRVNMRHGVSTVHSGLRFTLGVIFHDAK